MTAGRATPTRLLAMLLATCAHLACSNGATQLSCIHPPQTDVAADQKQAVAVSADLEKLLKLDEAQIKVEFQKTIKQQFDKMSDDNVSLLLFLEAIDCYLKHDKVGADIAREMAQTVRAWWASKHGLMGTGTALTPRERSLLKGPNEARILSRLGEFDIR